MLGQIALGRCAGVSDGIFLVFRVARARARQARIPDEYEYRFTEYEHEHEYEYEYECECEYRFTGYEYGCGARDVGKRCGQSTRA